MRHDVRFASPRLAEMGPTTMKFLSKLIVYQSLVLVGDVAEYVRVLGIESLGGAVVLYVATKLFVLGR